MIYENNIIERLCGFYVSDFHLATMLLPYINKKLEDKTRVVTILEKSIEENINILLKKLNLNNKEDILKINWKNINSNKYTDIKDILNQEIKNNTENVILINGKQSFIRENNNKIDKWLKKRNIKNLKIINLYEITEFNKNIIEILDKHDKILNTSGEKEIEEVFEGYKREKI